MKKTYIAMVTMCFVLTAYQNAAAAIARNLGGNWHTESEWVGGFLPSSSDTANLNSRDDIIELDQEAVTINWLNLGGFADGPTSLVTLNVRTNLTCATLNMGHAAGSGLIVVSNALFTVNGSVTLGTSSTEGVTGGLTILGGGVVTNIYRFVIGATGTLTLDDGVLQMRENIVMTDGSAIYLNGDSELWLPGDQTDNASYLSYISSGWIYGDGVAGKVDLTYDGTRTIVTAIPEPATLGLVIIFGGLIFAFRSRR